MEQSYSSLIGDLEESAALIRSQGVQIEALDRTIAELKRHVTNIEAVERNLSAVRDEVIAPIKKTLDENKRAGRFSILGFWVGAVGIVVTTLGVGYSMYQDRGAGIAAASGGDRTAIQTTPPQLDEIRRSLSALTLQLIGIGPDYKPTAGDLLFKEVGADREKVLLKSGVTTLSIALEESGEHSVFFADPVPYLRVSFLANGRVLADSALQGMVRVTRKRPLTAANRNLPVKTLTEMMTPHWLFEGDRLTLTTKPGVTGVPVEHTFEVVRVFRTRSQLLAVGDEFDGVLIRGVQ